ncbi:hypothetical protein RR48_07997 [Papilio machaon]|uniref:Uncharacterized protein n=1 Tax=Papilio machaon TaxID=76193 RepID=A0A194R747_PAPMA|nr:hypothetical protein RR48_07997 [Papilio machaon]
MAYWKKGFYPKLFTYVDLPSDVVGLVTEKSVGCIAETGADINILQRVFQWQFDDDKTSKKFSFCLFKSTGLIDDSGKFDENQIVNSLYRNSNKKDEIAKVAKECSELGIEFSEEDLLKFSLELVPTVNPHLRLRLGSGRHLSELFAITGFPHS